LGPPCGEGQGQQGQREEDGASSHQPSAISRQEECAEDR
jgi:hypothetical protein